MNKLWSGDYYRTDGIYDSMDEFDNLSIQLCFINY